MRTEQKRSSEQTGTQESSASEGLSALGLQFSLLEDFHLLYSLQAPGHNRQEERAELKALYIKASGHQRREMLASGHQRQGDAGGGTPRFRPSHRQN